MRDIANPGNYATPIAYAYNTRMIIRTITRKIVILCVCFGTLLKNEKKWYALLRVAGNYATTRRTRTVRMQLRVCYA